MNFRSLIRRHQMDEEEPHVKDLTCLPEQFRAALLSMYGGEPQLGVDGKKHELDKATRIPESEGMWLYNLCKEVKPEATLEIGLAYGFSTIYFLAALFENRLGNHTAIDAYQRTHPGIWAGIGMLHAARLGMGERFKFIEEMSFDGLVHLHDKGEEFKVIFIDGNHKFDDVLVDFTLAARICPIKGYIVMDDMWMPSIRKTVSFVSRNRSDFNNIETPVENISVFQRIKKDTREWCHFEDFK